MKGFGTNENKLSAHITPHTHADMALISATYSAEIKRDLLKDIISETSGDYLRVLRGLVMPPAAYDAYILHDAFSGIGCNETVLSEVLCSRSSAHLAEVKIAYQMMYEKKNPNSLKARITSEVSMPLRAVYLHMIEGKQDPGGEHLLETHVTDLSRASDSKGLFGSADEVKFIQILAGHQRAHVETVGQGFQKLKGQFLPEMLKNKFSGDLLNAFQVVTTPVVKFMSEKLLVALKKFNVDEVTIIRIVCGQKEKELLGIDQYLFDTTGKQLFTWISEKMGGDAGRALGAMVARFGKIENIEVSNQ
jgi:hypothetical protein